MERRTFLRASVLGAGTMAFSGSLWQQASLAAPAHCGTSPYGGLLSADSNGITPDELWPFLRINGQSSSEITGPAFTPNGTRLYFSSQRGTSGASSGGITYEVTGPFRS